VALEEQFGDSLVAVARSAAQLVSKPYAVQLAPGDEPSRTYKNLRDKLAALKEAAKVQQIYLVDPQEHALLDSNGTFAIGEPIVKLAANRAELKEALAGFARASVLFADREGQLFKTGFAPVRIDGEVRAVIGVDGSARFFEPLGEMGRTLWLAGALALALAILTTWFVSRRITRPLGRLAEAARAIGQGDLARPVQPETTDEIGFLARTLNEMRQSIEERDQQLQMMLSGIAHEVRNPLGGMALFAGLLKEEVAGNATALEHLRRINTELDYLARVVNDFLDFARKRPVETTEADPRQEAEEIKQLCEGDLQRSQVRLEIRVDPAVGVVVWDRERMRRVMLNLVQNALQASPAGSTVLLSLERAAGGIRLRVTDSGHGIPEDKRPLIFRPFFTTRQQGTGLGLALAKKIAEAHGGTISFTSTAGAGTTFELWLPEPRAS
jgi:signal transduction histidine kinase